jgi:PIN domain nuclease of toxin-antitoxin system
VTAIIDAAALLALLLDEPGAQTVMPVLRASMMSAVNVSESCSRGVERGATIAAVLDSIRRFEIAVVPFDLVQARIAAELRPAIKHVGASLGDRACLALAQVRGLPIYTGDRRMGSLQGQLGIDIRLIR